VYAFSEVGTRGQGKQAKSFMSDALRASLSTNGNWPAY